MQTILSQGFALGSVLLVAVYPTPEDFKEAWAKTLSPAYFEEVETSLSEEAEALNALAYKSGVFTQFAHDPVVECLPDKETLNAPSVLGCASRLYRTIEAEKITTTSFTGSVQSVGIPDTQIENARLALANLCRTVWAASDGDIHSLMTPACAEYASGVAVKSLFE